MLIDEASQVDTVTGVLALSCAKKAVVIGDRKQLDIVLGNKENTENTENLIQKTRISEELKIDPNYRFDKSILNSVLSVIKDGCFLSLTVMNFHSILI